MKIKKIIVDEKPLRCGDCLFCIAFYDDEHEEYIDSCVIRNSKVDTESEPICNYFKEENKKPLSIHSYDKKERGEGYMYRI